MRNVSYCLKKQKYTNKNNKIKNVKKHLELQLVSIVIRPPPTPPPTPTPTPCHVILPSTLAFGPYFDLVETDDDEIVKGTSLLVYLARNTPIRTLLFHLVKLVH